MTPEDSNILADLVSLCRDHVTRCDHDLCDAPATREKWGGQIVRCDVHAEPGAWQDVEKADRIRRLVRSGVLA